MRVGRSRRLRTVRACGKTQLEFTMRGWSGPSFGAAATEGWSERGAGLRHGSIPQTASALRPGPKGEQVLGRDLESRFRRRQG